MPKRRLRTCTACSVVEKTFSRCDVCAKCAIKIKKSHSIEEERKHLLNLGYKILGDPELTASGHRQYQLIAPCCGSKFSPTYGNILKQLASHKKPPCKSCGGKERISKAMSAYVDRYGANYDLNEFKEYRLKVRRLTSRAYECWKQLINPMDYPRGHGTGYWQLDHIVPIIWCFKNNITPEIAASVQNLQMLPAVENLHKGRKIFNDEEAIALLRESKLSSLLFDELGSNAREKIDLVADTANVFTASEKLIIREEEFKRSPAAVIARCKYSLGQIQNKLGARALNVREVQKPEAKRFLDKWHVQGSTPSSWDIGLYKDHELMAIMTFAVPRYKQIDVDYELVRFCSRGDVVISGAASKLFSHYLKTKKPVKTVSYSLNRWGAGNIYLMLGFKTKGTSSSPRYLWRCDGKIRSWRASVLMAKRRNIAQISGNIEGTLKIHDPGSTTWVHSIDV